jgi:Transcriptional regulatory protein, C terminal
MDARQTLRAHIANLRRKIEPADGVSLIHTDHGVGYRLADVHPDGARREGLPKKRSIASSFAVAFPPCTTLGRPLGPGQRAAVSWIVVWHELVAGSARLVQVEEQAANVVRIDRGAGGTRVPSPQITART